ncbi:pyruvate kinase [Candidatus Woesearchaeota archaeon]|nr:pyruvate kinase [Candidatus Woesearchaeota archaeon]|tara:strand:- start:22126 stop:23076 length:951 start_codon:yes stop_codon:yes gene_type:complete
MKRVIITTGPSFLYDNIIKDNHNDHYIYRINGSHGTIPDMEHYIQNIRSQAPNAKILIDLPGNKIRTKNLRNPIRLLKEKPFFLGFDQTNFSDFHKHIKPGDKVYANDSIYNFTVDEIKDGFIKFISHSDGILHSNKGIHVRGVSSNLPFLFQKDMEILDVVNRYAIDYVALSFVRTAEDIKLAKQHVKNSTIIAKVETKQAVENLSEILDLVEHILVDRGDLSADVGLVNVPHHQARIIKAAQEKNKKIFLATQFLKNMELVPIPTIAEVVDLTNTLQKDIHGIQLSEETSIGKNPIDCLKLIESIEKSIEENNK